MLLGSVLDRRLTLLPAPAKGHHTVWVHYSGCPARAVRYAVDGERLVCFGDRELAAVPDGTRVTAAVHEIAGGSSLVEFGATVREIPSDDIPASALAELLDHVSLGRDPAEVEAGLAVHRRRRVVELVP